MSLSSWLRAHLVGRGARDIQDLAAQRQDRLRLAVARLFRRAAGAVALDQKNLGAGGDVARAVGELAGQPQFARRALARHLLLLAAALALVGALGDAVEQQPAGRRVGAEPMVEMVAHRVLDQPRRLGGGQPFLGLPLELRVAQKHRQQHRRAAADILPGRLRDAAVAGQFGIGANAPQQRVAQPGLMRPALRGRDRVAIRMAEPVLLVLGPDDRPFDAARSAVGPGRRYRPHCRWPGNPPGR